MPTFDESGNIIPDAPASPPADVGAENTFGAAVWAFFHPGQVQQEYAATGQQVPEVTDIMGSAVDDMQTHAAAAVDAGFHNLAVAGRLIAAGVLVLAGAYIWHELTKRK